MFVFMQEVTHKLCDNLSMVANVGVTHPDYIMVSRTNEDRQHDQAPARREGEEQPSASPGEEAPVVSGDSDEVPAPASDVSSTAPSVTQEGERGEGERREGVKSEERRKAGYGGVVHTDGEKGERSSSEELLQPTLQALAVLSNVSCR